MRRYLLYFAMSVAVVLVPAALLSAWFEPIDGDLTRLGSYAERDYGWNSAQPALPIRANGRSVVAPELLVLGDSFSRGNIWQSALADRLKVHILSFQYDHVGCIDNWIAYAVDQPSAASVVMETVERVFVERFRDLPKCAPKTPSAFELPPATANPVRPDWPPEWHVRHTFRTALNLLTLGAGRQTSMNGEVINVPIASGCANFSHRRRDRMLYYAKDAAKQRWDRDEQSRAIANVMKIQQQFAKRGKRFMFVVVPDKLSVYRHCLLEDADRDAAGRVNITRELIAAGVNTPDLLGVFEANAARIVDLYLPNNTHLSRAGYAFMAGELAPGLGAERPLPPATHKRAAEPW